MVEENETSSEEQVKSEEEQAPPASEQMVPVAKHAALRTRAQDAELKNARLEGQLEVLTQQKATEDPAAKSPLELEIARQTAEGIDEEDQSISPRVLKAETIHQRQLDNKQLEADKATKHNTVRAESLRKAKIDNPEFMATINAADGLLTQGELLDLSNAGADVGDVAFSLATRAIERNKPVKTEETAPKTKLSESEAEMKVKADAEAKVKADAEKVPSQDEVLKSDNPRISHVMNL